MASLHASQCKRTNSPTLGFQYMRLDGEEIIRETIQDFMLKACTGTYPMLLKK